MQIRQTNLFKKAYKRLHINQLCEINKAIQSIIDNPLVGTKKVGDLADVYVFKTKILSELFLIAYTYQKDLLILTFLAIGVHENFYRDLKNS